jgi:hypothetical protein
MTDKQIALLRSIIQKEIYLVIKAQKVERSFDVEVKTLDHMWDEFERTFWP